MKMNIVEWAKLNNMSPTQYKKEIMECAAAIGSLSIDEGMHNEYEFECSDNISDIIITIKRENHY